MRHFLFTPRSWAVMLCSAAALFLSAAAFADPPARVARLAQIGGTVSFSPAGEQDWELAQANRPITTGDRLWADTRSHAELQIGTAAARLGENTSVTLLNLDDRIAQFQLAQGSLNVRVRRIEGDQFYEVDTPNLAFSIRRAGDYRVDVDPDGATTVIQVRNGEGEAWGEGTAYTIDAGQQYTFAGEGMRDVRYDPLPPQDEFDRWCFDRNRREDAAVSARYVSPELVGYSDLDEYGTWRNVEGYGNVWVPTQVAVDWVPYHYGHWGWVEPWGWTWIDDAPWGFAPFHYGRWAFLSSHWCWVPGPVGLRPVYAPALVAFVGGGGFSLSIGGGPVTGVAWFPLGVGEVYRPSYEVSRTYFTNINVTNTVINTTVVTNVYNNPNAQINYRNVEVAHAITAVPVNAFASGERVERHAVAVSRDVVARQPVTNFATVTPTHASVLAAAAVGGAAAVAAVHRPPERVLTRQVVARTQPPAPPPSFATRASLLSSQPGRPLDNRKLQTLRTERPAAEAPKVKVVSPSVTPRPIEQGVAKGGPRAAPGGQAQEERAARERKGGPQPGGAPQPPTAAQERFKGGPPQGQAAGGGADQRALRERRGGPPEGVPPSGQAQQEERARNRGPQAGGVPQPPAAAQERFKGGPPQGQAAGGAEERARRGGGPPQGGPQGPQGTAQEERALKERRGGPQGAQQAGPAPRPPATAEERRGGPPAAASGGGQEERAQRERRGGPPQAAGPQGGPPPERGALRERGGPPEGRPQGGPPPEQGAMRERSGPPQGRPQGGPPPEQGAMRERRAGPPQGMAQSGPPPSPPQAQHAPSPPPQAQHAPSPPPQTQRASVPQPQAQAHQEGRGRGEGKEKEKEKEQRGQ